MFPIVFFEYFLVNFLAFAKKIKTLQKSLIKVL